MLHRATRDPDIIRDWGPPGGDCEVSAHRPLLLQSLLECSSLLLGPPACKMI